MNRHTFILLLLLICSHVSAESFLATITSKNSVKIDGDIPVGCEISYLQTAGGKAGQVTADNYNSLIVSNSPEMWIRKITLMMHSNSSSGAGIIELYVDDHDIYANRPGHFSDSDWAGKYTTTDVPIILNIFPPLKVSQGQIFEIAVSAFENSLYVSSYLVEYSYASPEPCQVSFSTHTTIEIPPIQEQSIGEGITLPNLEAPDSWYFAGWAEQSVDILTEAPVLFKPETEYYPTSDITLHAVYTNTDYITEFTQDTTLTSGLFMLADPLFKCVATNEHNKHIHSQYADVNNNNKDSLFTITTFEVAPDSTIFEITFDENKALIRHHKSKKWVGYAKSNKKELTTDSVWWDVEKIKFGQVLFSHTYSNETRRELRAEFGDKIEIIDSLWFVCSLATSKKWGIALIRVPQIEGRIYTSYPLGNSVDETFSEEINIVNGHLINARKEPFYLFDIKGQLITVSANNIDMNELPIGIYLLKAKGKIFKIYHKH